MDAAKRRAIIKSQAAKKVEDGGQALKGTGLNISSTKRKIPLKGMSSNIPATEKPWLPSDTIVGLEAEAKHGVGKGLMKGPSSSQKKPPVLLCEDPKYAPRMLTSIMTAEDYEDLGNHSTEVMGETGLFGIVQVIWLIHSPFVLTF